MTIRIENSFIIVKKKKKSSSIQGSIENTLLREHPYIHVQYLLQNQTKLFQTYILLQV